VVGTQARPRGIRVRLAYANEDEFVKTYCYYCEQEAVFAPTEKVIPANSECAFSLELTDGTPMLRGLGVVLDCWTTDDNRFGRRGVYIGFSQLTTTSEAIHARMLALRKAEEEENTEVTQIPVAPRTRNIRATQQQWGSMAAAAEIAMPEVEETDVGDLRKSITQEMRAASESGLLAAAIPQPIEEKTQHTARYEGPLRGPAMPAKRAASPIPLAALAAAAAAERPASAPPPPSPSPRSPTPSPTPTVKPALPQLTPIAKQPAPAATATATAAASTPIAAAAASTTTAAAAASTTTAAASSMTAAVDPQERPSAPALPPIPFPAPRPALGSNPMPPVQMARGSSPATEGGLPSSIAPASSAGIAAATPVVPKESEIATEPMVVQGSWQDRVQQIRARAHEASQKAWRRAQTTAANGLAIVRTEATQWRANPRTAAERWKPTRRSTLIFAGGILCGLIVALIFRSSPPAPPKPAASSPNRMAALFQRPLITEECKDTKPETELAALEAPAPAASIATTTKKPHAKSNVATTTKHPALATAKPPTTTKPATVAKTTQPTTTAKTQPAPTAKTQPATIAKTTQPATTTTKPATIAKTTQPATTTTKPATIAKTTQPATTTTKPATIAKTTQPATTTTKPATIAKTTAPTTTTKPATVAKTTPATTTAKTQPSATAKPATTKTPVQAKTSPAKKKDCGLDCI
jgi:hypothetical protein